MRVGTMFVFLLWSSIWHKLVLSVCWMYKLKIQKYLYNIAFWNETNQIEFNGLSVLHLDLENVIYTQDNSNTILNKSSLRL